MGTVVAEEALQGRLHHSLGPVLRAMGSSLGPEGRSVLYSFGDGARRASTGVTIAREGDGGSGVDRIAPALLKETLVALERDYGDGASRLGVMLGAALDEGRRALAGGVVPGALARALSDLRGEMAAAFAAEARPAVDAEGLARAAGAPPDLARRIADAVAAVGPEGQVELVAARAATTGGEAIAGFVLDTATPLDPGALAVLEAPHVIAANEVISDFQHLAPVIEAFATRGRTLLVVCRGIEGAARALIERNSRAGLCSVSVAVPAYAGLAAAAAIADLAAVTGATLVSPETGVEIATLKPSMLGRAARLRRASTRLMLEAPAGDPAAIALRSGEIRGEIRANRHLSLDRERAERRLARLNGRWCELAVAETSGPLAPPLLEIGRRALASIALARREGVIEGGGSGLEAVAHRLGTGAGTPDAAAARRVARAALLAVGRQIRANSGEPACWSAPRRAAPDAPPPDPALLSRVVAEQALSLAGQLLSLELAVARPGAHRPQGHRP